jgi:catechol 2,3-dioxygenase-like lactoylglutathione lyase family enzyme
MTSPEPLAVRRIARFSLTSANAEKLSGFYEKTFGFRLLSKRRHSGAEFERITGVPGGATSVTLQLGLEVVELLEYDSPGLPYPARATSADMTFQHLALVVANMESAYSRLLSVQGWKPISTASPEHLPESSGNVAAFKFRDPEGHPLELLAFPKNRTPIRWRPTGHPSLFLGVDHSAISIRDTARSLAFYRALGFHVSAHTVNQGPEQQRLDGVPQASVEVAALAPPEAGPHLELLCYGSHSPAHASELRNNDIAATRTVLEAAPAALSGVLGRREYCFRDPDGHYLQRVSASSE